MPAVEQGAQPLDMDQQRIGTNALPLGIGAGLIAFAAGFGEGFEQSADAGLQAVRIVVALDGAGGIGGAPRLHDAALVSACSRSPSAQRAP